MACVLAEKSGKKREQLLLNKSNYSLLQSSLNIEIWDPRMTTVSRIMEHVTRNNRYCLFIVRW